MRTERVIPLIVATALFMEHMDSTVIGTSLPAIAADIGTSPLTLKLAITSYLMSLAIFMPASGWMADRFGARVVFSGAITVFMAGSIGCAFAQSIEHFVLARILQGVGGAMMTPVGRLVLVQTIAKRELVAAMAWVTMPALVGPMVGPPLGGFITTYFSWHWIFLINIPIGIAGIAFANRYIPDIKSEIREPFDLYGAVLAGIGVAGLMFGMSVAGLGILPWWLITILIAVGAVSMTLYVRYSLTIPAPVLDFSLLRIQTLYASVVGGFLFRVGLGAVPFLLPLLMQLGFGLSPFASGLVTFTSVVGAFTMKGLAPALINRFGFRTLMIWACVISSAFLAAYALFVPPLPLVVIAGVLMIGGFFRFADVLVEQRDCLCRCRESRHDPRFDAGECLPATGARERRGRRRGGGGNDHRLAQRTADRRAGFRPRLYPDGRHLDGRGVHLYAAAGECRTVACHTDEPRSYR